jgi:hypothetical protein
MNTKRSTLLGLSLSIALVSFAAASRAQDDMPKPAQFRDLLAVGSAVYLYTPADNPYYSVQLLSAEQTATVRRENAELDAKRDQIERINQKLTMEQRLAERGALLLEQDKLEGEIAGVVRERGANTYYEVAHVGEDYVALKRDGRETFVPFGSIRTMFRSEELTARPSAREPSRGFADRSRFPISGSFGGPGDFGGRGGRGGSSGFGGGDSSRLETLAQLQFIKAGPAAEALKKLFADKELEITIDETSNSLGIIADRATLQSVIRLLERLDAKTE